MFRTRLREFARLKALVRARRSRKVRLKRPQIVPAEYAGKWVAWSSDGLRIIGVGDSPAAALAEATQKGQPDVIYEWIPTQEMLRPGVGP